MVLAGPVPPQSEAVNTRAQLPVWADGVCDPWSSRQGAKKQKGSNPGWIKDFLQNFDSVTFLSLRSLLKWPLSSGMLLVEFSVLFGKALSKMTSHMLHVYECSVCIYVCSACERQKRCWI